MNESSRDLTGRELGDYRVLRRLGAGGMAEVYLAEQQSLGRQVALKVLLPSLASDATYVQRFLNEARAAASLVHKNIVQIYEVGQTQGHHFIAQEYVPGKNLGQVVQRHGAFEPGLVLDILRQVVSALCKAHEMGIVHRDIKPENILLSNSGEVKVADFGLVRVQHTDTQTLTQVGVAMGTPLYMSPEQIEGRPVDVRSDIYSLGITCYHLLSGVPPHTGETALAIAVQHLNTTPRPLENVRPDLPSSLARIVHQMISKKPDGRPASPSLLLGELRTLATAAAAEGWAEVPDHWSLAEWVASDVSRTGSAQRLGELMKEESRLQSDGTNWKRLAMSAVVAVLAGVVLGAVTRPRFFLATARPLPVPLSSSAGAQLYHAKMNDSEAAWVAAIKYPGADSFLQQLAKQGLVRFYLLDSEEYRKAIPVLRELVDASKGNPALESMQAFGYAGLCICHERLRDQQESIRAREQLTTDRLDILRENDRQISEMLQTTIERLEGSD